MRDFPLVSGVDVRLLGPVELRVDGLAVPIERVQVRRLLALLAVRAGLPWATDALVEELWPGALPQSPRAAVRTIASRLRHALSHHSARLRLTGDAYQLELETGDVDLATFDALVAGEADADRLDAGLALWRGTPFGGAHGPPALDREAARLESSRVAARCTRAELLIAARAFDRAAGAVAPVVDEHPTNERAAVLMASALAGGGRRTDALAVLRRSRSALLDDHGLDPDDELAQTEQRILAMPPTTRAAVVAPPAAADRNWPSGRDREIEVLCAWLTEHASTGDTRCVLIEGPAGIGKTAVAVAVARRLGDRTVHVHCDPDARTGHALATALNVSPPPSGGDARGRAIAVVEALVERAITDVADQRVVLLIDDIQWASEVELRFLSRMVRARSAERLSLLVARRDPEPVADDPTARRLLASLAEHDHTLTMRLPPLDERATRAAYASWGGRPLTARSASALLSVTGGLPYLIRVLALTGQEPSALPGGLVTDRLRDTIEARLVGFDESAQRVLATTAAMGRSVDVEVIAEACGIDARSGASLVDRALNAGLVTVGPNGLQFDHELTRLHLADKLGPASRLVIHRDAMHASVRLGRDPVVVARHVVGAGALCTDEAAAARLLAGADGASRSGEFADAALFLERAAELEDDDARRLEIQRRQAWMLECAGDQPSADALIGNVFATARQRGWTDVMARAALAGSSVGGVVGGAVRRRARLEAALASPPEDERLRLDVATAMIRELNSADEPIPAELWRALDELARDDDTRAARLGVELQVALRSPSTAQLVADAREYVAAARETGQPLNVLDAEEGLVRVLLTAGDILGAEEAVGDLRRTVQRHRWPRYVWSLALLDATLADLHHGAAAADEAAQQAMTIGHEHGVEDALGAYAVFRLSVAFREGGLAELAPVVRSMIESRPTVPGWRAVLAAALADGGDLDGARRELEQFIALSAEAPKLFHHGGTLFGVRAARIVGDRALLARCVDWLWPWSGGLLIVGAGAGCFGPADLVLAEGLAALGDARALPSAHAGEQLLAVHRATAWLPAGQGGSVYGL